MYVGQRAAPLPHKLSLMFLVERDGHSLLVLVLLLFDLPLLPLRWRRQMLPEELRIGDCQCVELVQH